MTLTESSPSKLKNDPDKSEEQSERERLFACVELFKLRACKRRESWTYNIFYGPKDKKAPTLEGFYNLCVLSFMIFVFTHPIVINYSTLKF